MEMEDFKDTIRKAILAIDFTWNVSSEMFSEAQKLRRAAELIAALFAGFLEIHPYVNGNGHMGRLVVLCLFARLKVHLRRWPLDLDPRPTDPPYSEVIRQY